MATHYWADWDTTGLNGEATYDTLYYVYNYYSQSCYWFSTHECDLWHNILLAIYVLKTKIDELIAPPPVSMDSILNAMLAAKFDELQKFIGIEDAYRCALWDAPFNEYFYAALARGFKKW